MAKAKNTPSNNQDDVADLFDISSIETTVIESVESVISKKDTITTENEQSIEILMKDLEEIESRIANGNLSISDQINQLNRAKEIVKDIKSKLENVKSQINIIENE